MSAERTVRIAVTRAVLEDEQLWLKVRELKLAALKEDDEREQPELRVVPHWVPENVDVKGGLL